MSPSHSPSRAGAERRRYPRSRIPFYVSVSGLGAGGEEINDVAILHNISRGGLYIRIPHCFAEGSDILCLVRFSTDSNDGPQLPVRGRVLRSEVRTLGICDMAVELTRPLLEEFD